MVLTSSPCMVGKLNFVGIGYPAFEPPSRNSKLMLLLNLKIPLLLHKAVPDIATFSSSTLIGFTLLIN